MNTSSDMPRFARTPRLARMRSQRIVHVVQTEKDDNVSVSFVTISKDGQAEETQETVDFCSLKDEDIRESVSEKTVIDDLESDKEVVGELIFFDVDLDDASAPQLTPHENAHYHKATRSRKTSLFSDDEFEPIRMKLPKRTPQPLRLSKHKAEQGVKDCPQSSRSPHLSSASDVSSHSVPPESPTSNLDNSPTLRDQGDIPDTAVSSSTLFSVASASSSITCVDSTGYTKSTGGRIFCEYEKDGCSSPKVVDVVTPDSITGTRGLVDLRVYGYDFGWSRFEGRFGVPYGLSPEDAAELEVFLSRGPNTFLPCHLPKRSPKKSVFERKFLEVLKMIK